MDLRGQSDMRKLEEVTGRKYKPLKYWANFDPSDAKLVFDVSPRFVFMSGAAMTEPRCLPKCFDDFGEVRLTSLASCGAKTALILCVHCDRIWALLPRRSSACVT